MKLLTPRNLLGCFGILALMIGGIMMGAAFRAGFLPTRPFDAAVWKQVEHTLQLRPADGFPRLEMVDSLIESKQLDGKSRDEIIALLGQPPESGHFADWDAVYWLGPERNFFLRLDSEWLVLRFDDDDHVSEYQLVGD